MLRTKPGQQQRRGALCVAQTTYSQRLESNKSTKLNTFEIFGNISLIQIHSRNYSKISQFLIPYFVPGYARAPCVTLLRRSPS